MDWLRIVLAPNPVGINLWAAEAVQFLPVSVPFRTGLSSLPP